MIQFPFFKAMFGYTPLIFVDHATFKKGQQKFVSRDVSTRRPVPVGWMLDPEDTVLTQRRSHAFATAKRPFERVEFFRLKERNVLCQIFRRNLIPSLESRANRRR